MRPLFYKEVFIEAKSTVKRKFTCCSNSECNSVFAVELKESYTDSDFLCPECRLKLFTHHTVQCGNCNSVIDFFPIGEDETPVVFYSKKCRNCTGTLEDERKILPFLYPEIFM